MDSIDSERHRSITAKRFGIRAGFMSFLHDLLRLRAFDARERAVKFHAQSVTALVVLDQTHFGANAGVRERRAKLLGGI